MSWCLSGKIIFLNLSEWVHCQGLISSHINIKNRVIPIRSEESLNNTAVFSEKRNVMLYSVLQKMSLVVPAPAKKKRWPQCGNDMGAVGRFGFSLFATDKAAV